MILGSLSLTSLFLASALTGAVTIAPTAVVRGDILYFGDVADTGVLPEQLRQRAAQLALMKLPNNADDVDLRAEDVAARARALMPALAPWLTRAKGDVSILRRRPDPMRPLAYATQPNGILKDDVVQLTVTAGVYTVERQGVAMSDGKPGQALFIRTEDDKVISALCCRE
jgi:hypothetical protein